MTKSSNSIEAIDDPRYTPFDLDSTYWAVVSKKVSGHYLLGEDVSNHDSLVRVSHLIMRICRHDFNLPFSKRFSYRRPRLHIDSLGRSVIVLLTLDLDPLRAVASHHSLAPTIEALMEVVKSFKPNTPPSELRFIDEAEMDSAVREYNELVLKLRQVLRAEGMGERVKSFRRNATRNYRHLMGVIRASHERHRKLLLIRLDWSENDVDPSAPIEQLSQADFDTAALRLANARDKMVHHLKSHFKGDLAFYAWKIEWGVQKGFHIHWLVGLNGSKYQDRINVPYHIAKHWDEVLFNGGSHTHNINAMPGKDRVGLCVLHYADSQAGSFFGLYADYLTKVDYNLKLRLPNGMRSFGCSKLNRRAGRKTGPDRSYQMPCYDIDAVRGKRGRATGRRFTVKSLTKELQ